MRAHTTNTITTMTRPRRNAWRRAVALALGVCALAIPASASGYSSVNAVTGGSNDSSQPVGSSDSSSVSAITGGSSTSTAPGAPQYSRTPTELGQRVATSKSAHRVDPGNTSLNAIAGPSPGGSPSPASSADGFHWGDAALGAGTAMAVLALGGAALLTVRRRTAVSPSAASSS
jgi:hypothetical protein